MPLRMTRDHYSSLYLLVFRAFQNCFQVLCPKKNTVFLKCHLKCQGNKIILAHSQLFFTFLSVFLLQGSWNNDCYGYYLWFSWRNRSGFSRNTETCWRVQISKPFHQPVLSKTRNSCCKSRASSSTRGENPFIGAITLCQQLHRQTCFAYPVPLARAILYVAKHEDIQAGHGKVKWPHARRGRQYHIFSEEEGSAFKNF